MDARNLDKSATAGQPEHVQRLIMQLKDFYAGFSSSTIALAENIYTQDVEFRDPVHTLHGVLALKGYFRRMAVSLQHYQIHYLDELVGDNSAYLSWEMEFCHKKINGGKPVRVRGMSQIKFAGKIYFHEDSYDLGVLLYEHVPVLGGLIRGLKRKLAR